MDQQLVQWLPEAPFSPEVAEFKRLAVESHTCESLRQAVQYYLGDLLPSLYED